MKIRRLFKIIRKKHKHKIKIHIFRAFYDNKGKEVKGTPLQAQEDP
jgi:hypothetical protein